jgi:hypothetical protein
MRAGQILGRDERMANRDADKPFRVGVFNTVAGADRAIRKLLAAGFTKDQLAVVCSDKYKEQHFRDLSTPDPSGSHTPEAIAVGGAAGAAIGGLALAAATIATGGVGLLAAGTVLIGGGAIAGAFTGAMLTRGFEKEIQDYYDQAVLQGKILVAVEIHGEGSVARLAQAESVLAEAGAEPVALVEG